MPRRTTSSATRLRDRPSRTATAPAAGGRSTRWEGTRRGPEPARGRSHGRSARPTFYRDSPALRPINGAYAARMAMRTRGPGRAGIGPRRRKRLMLITGGSGFLGRHLTTALASSTWEFVAPSSSSMDIRRDSTIDGDRGLATGGGHPSRIPERRSADDRRRQPQRGGSSRSDRRATRSSVDRHGLSISSCPVHRTRSPVSGHRLRPRQARRRTRRSRRVPAGGDHPHLAAVRNRGPRPTTARRAAGACRRLTITTR